MKHYEDGVDFNGIRSLCRRHVRCRVDARRSAQNRFANPEQAINWGRWDGRKAFSRRSSHQCASIYGGSVCVLFYLWAIL